MDLQGLRDLLTTLREQGVAKAGDISYARLSTGDSFSVGSVEFAPERITDTTPVTPGGLVDADGKPVDFDKDLPDLARDPIREANFAKAGKAS